MAYTPPAGDNIVLRFTSGYTPPQGDDIALYMGIRPDAEPVPVPVEGHRMPWGKLRRLDGGTSIPWRGMENVDRSLSLPFARAERRLQQEIAALWAGSTPTDGHRVAMGWSEVSPQQQTSRLPWLNPRRKDRTARLPWGELEPHDLRVVVPFTVRCRKVDDNRQINWQENLSLDDRFVVPWINSLPRKDLLYRAFWGRELYKRVCTRDYLPPPGDKIILRMDTPISQVGDGLAINLYFDRLTNDLRCKQREPSGWRDPYTYIPPKKWPKAPKLGVYYIMNWALLTRVSDRAPVEVFRMEVAEDIESWCWNFSARVPAASLALVMPIDEPVAVEAEINGYKWVVLIESWSESSSFGRREFQIRGRSVSAVLADPYAPAHSAVNGLAANARQLAEAELTDTGWVVEWGIVDWLVGAGALSYSNNTPLKVIQRIVETAGGRLLSHRYDTRLLARPRLHSLPWTWAAATPDLEVSDYVVRKLSREYLPGVSFNAVFVSGEHQGVLTKVYRSGTTGDAVAPMVTDALITDVEPARERGRMVIGRSGKWSREGLELPLTAPETLPGLLEIGQLISMDERGQNWRGQVVGVKVTADRSNGLRVAQDIDVERWYGD